MGGNTTFTKKLFYYSFLAIIIISTLSQITNAVSISPSELTIRNIDVRRDYQFIVLLESNKEGLVDVELRTSHNSVRASPDKFMLNEGEQRSIRLHLDPNEVGDQTNIRVQPYVNNVPTEDRLVLSIEDSASSISEEDNINQEIDRSIIEEPAVFTLIIYGLIFIVAILVIIIFIPEIKKKIKKTKIKTKEKSQIWSRKRLTKKINNLSKRINDSDTKVKKLIDDVEKFHDASHKWLIEKSGGKYGLE